MKYCTICERSFEVGAFQPCERSECARSEASLVTIQQRAPDADPLVGAMLTDRIRLDSKIGEGGMGSVYRGEDIMLGRQVAVKVLRQELKGRTEDVKRFFNEAKVVAKLRHPNTIQVFDFGENPNGVAYIAMEFLSGEPLDVHLGKHEISLGRILEIIEQICLSLEEAHEAGIVHRDLKPDNIFIDTVANRRIVKVIDFGIAKLVSGGENLTQAGMVFGTPAYMSPEQARGEVLDARSDIYSLGCVIFAMLAGRSPFVGTSPMEIAVQHVTAQPPDVASLSTVGALPDALVALVNSMLAKSREQRPQSITEVRRLLLDVARVTPGLRLGNTRDTGSLISVGTQPTGQRPVTATTTMAASGVSQSLPVSAGSGRKGLVAAIVTVVALLAVAGVFIFTKATQSTEPAVAGDGVASDVAALVVAPASGSGTPAVAAPAVDIAPALVQASRALRGAVVESTLAARDAVVSIRVASRPPGATVTRADGAVLGTTPFDLPALRGATELPLTFSHDGYTAQSRAVSLSADGTLEVELVRIAQARAERPRDPEPVAEPEAAPSEGTGRRRFVPREPVTIPVNE